jgi:hypothetical protein
MEVVRQLNFANRKIEYRYRLWLTTYKLTRGYGNNPKISRLSISWAGITSSPFVYSVETLIPIRAIPEPRGPILSRFRHAPKTCVLGGKRVFAIASAIKLRLPLAKAKKGYSYRGYWITHTNLLALISRPTREKTRSSDGLADLNINAPPDMKPSNCPANDNALPRDRLIPLTVKCLCLWLWQ